MNDVNMKVSWLHCFLCFLSLPVSSHSTHYTVLGHSGRRCRGAPRTRQSRRCDDNKTWERKAVNKSESWSISMKILKMNTCDADNNTNNPCVIVLSFWPSVSWQPDSPLLDLHQTQPTPAQARGGQDQGLAWYIARRKENQNQLLLFTNYINRLLKH